VDGAESAARAPYVFDVPALAFISILIAISPGTTRRLARLGLAELSFPGARGALPFGVQMASRNHRSLSISREIPVNRSEVSARPPWPSRRSLAYLAPSWRPRSKARRRAERLR